MKGQYRIKRTYLNFILIAFILVAGSCASTRSSDKREWVLLGREKVGFINESDAITVNKKTAYTAIRFLVEDRPIRLHDLKIYFDNGTAFDASVDSDIQPGEYSRVIDLPGNKRKIDKIEFRYRTTGNILKGRATIKLYGMR
jgi:hypothetical protein